MISLAAPAVALGGLLIPLIGRYVLKIGEQAQRRSPIRSWGVRLGVVSAAAIILALVANLTRQSQDWVFLSALTLAFGLGLAGFRLRARVSLKIMLQIALGLATAAAGYRIPATGGASAVVDVIVTTVFVVGVINVLIVLNFIDGFASLVIFVASGCTVLVHDLTVGVTADPPAMLYSLALCGASLGFFMFKRPSSRAYMDDPGALFLGVAMAALAVRTWGAWGRGSLDPAVFLPLVLILPVLAASVHRERMALLRRQRLALILIVFGHLPAWIPIALQTGAASVDGYAGPMFEAVLSIGSMTAWAGFITQGRALRGWSLRLVPEPIADVLRVALVVTAVQVVVSIVLGFSWFSLVFILLAAGWTTTLLIAQVTWWRMRVERSGVASVIVFGDHERFQQTMAVLDQCGDIFGGPEARRSEIGVRSKHFREAVVDHLRRGSTVLVLDEAVRSLIIGYRSLGDLVFASDCLVLRYLFEDRVETKWTRARDRIDEFAHRIIALLIFVALLPASIATMLFIMLEDGRPCLFSQYRTGRRGSPYTMFKFRSMKKNLPKQGFPPTSEYDPRITRVGRLIRKLGVDEIPQLWNVIKGEMRLVGPRPDQPFVCLGYTPRERRRLEVAPGLTGLWQLCPHRTEPIHYHVEYDFAYLHARGLILDIAICVATPLVALKGGKV
ncbi:MAG: sugar transferase [Phycisphaerales bacterium]